MDGQRKSRGEKLEVLLDEVDSIKEQMSNLHKEAAERREAIQKQQHEIELTEQAIEDCESVEEIQGKIRFIDEKLTFVIPSLV
jgi:peptidoglycan hydrolase CwlO-like protein